VCTPKVIFADEPTGNLDTKSEKMIMDILRELNEKHGHTVIIITHDDFVAEYANRKIHIIDGRIDSDRKSRKVPIGERARKNVNLATHEKAQKKARKKTRKPTRKPKAKQ
jgi:energy-coupling factor transporter ATP-binding protein EcfA2